jgi:exopolysaccharide biosynthesis protein
MNALPHCAWLLLFFCASAGAAGWERVVAGIDYRHLQHGGLDAHVVRIDLDVRSLEVVATTAAERGLAVSDFARGRGAVVAINGDYFDTSLNPFGLAMGDGVVWWQAVAGVRRQEVVGVGHGRLRIFPRDAPLREPKRWMTGAVAGWPMVVEHCAPVTALPGSAHFTLAPHPRTAVGLSKDRRRLLFVVADGRREGVPGLTLPELAAVMVEAGACTALNLDGGGSSALWLRDRVVNRPSDGFERKVANHLGVVEVRRKR